MTLAIKLITPEAGMQACPVCKETTFGYVGDGSSHLTICLDGSDLEVCAECAKKRAPALLAALRELKQLKEAREMMSRRGTVGAFRILGSLLRPEPKKPSTSSSQLPADRRKALPG